MAKISRSDWAASVPWSGITGKPSSFGPTDISDLTATGYRNGQYPVAVAHRLRATTLVLPPPPTPAPAPTPASISKTYVVWDVPSLHPLQSAEEDFSFLGAVPGMAVCVGAPFNLSFVNLSAYCFALDSVRIVVTNMSLVDVDLGSGSYQLVIFR